MGLKRTDEFRRDAVPIALSSKGSGFDPGDHLPDEGRGVLREPKAMRFRFIEEHRDSFPTHRLCDVMDVSPRGLRAVRN